jgi:hypothetical protein
LKLELQSSESKKVSLQLTVYPGLRLEDNIKMDLKEIKIEFVGWVHLAQDGVGSSGIL